MLDGLDDATMHGDEALRQQQRRVRKMREKLEKELLEAQQGLAREKQRMEDIQQRAALAEKSFQEEAATCARSSMRYEGAIIALSKSLGIPVRMAPPEVNGVPVEGPCEPIPVQSDG